MRSKDQNYRHERDRRLRERALRYVAMCRRRGETDLRIPTPEERRRWSSMVAVKIEEDVEYAIDHWRTWLT